MFFVIAAFFALTTINKQVSDNQRGFLVEKSRVLGFSDGVLAIVITIMVLSITLPTQPTWEAALEVAPSLFTYLLSFVYVGIYWNNHHHFFALVKDVNGTILWANLHLLFWLSLVPLSTRWINDSGFAQIPVFVYGLNLLLAALAFTLLTSIVRRGEGPDGDMKKAFEGTMRWKTPATLILYVGGTLLALANPLIGFAAFIVAALIWLVPERRIEKYIAPS